MSSLILKPVIYGALLGLVFTILYAAFTTKMSGRHVMTGEPVELSGFSAMFAKMGELGVSQYLVSLVPSYVLISFVVALVLGALKWFGNNA